MHLLWLIALLNFDAPGGDRYAKLPLGAIRAEGWLLRQLQAQGQGLGGNLPELWPVIGDSAWRGGAGKDNGENTPYYLNGFVPLAYLLDDQALIAKARPYVEWILASARADGSFGPAANADPWTRVLVLKALMPYYEITGDRRALALMEGYFRLLEANPPPFPEGTWHGMRALEFAVVARWLERQTGNAQPMRAVDGIRKRSFDWAGLFRGFPFDTAALREGRIPHGFRGDGQKAHGVNLAMALKYPAYFGDRQSVDAAFAALDQHHGQLTGAFSGDDHLSGRSPNRGVELCLVVDEMFSLEKLIEIFGETAHIERLEKLAYNALPAAISADGWSHLYLQQTNQVMLTQGKRGWSSVGPDGLTLGLMGEHPSCLVNMHQGWPRFVEHLWMGTEDGGLAALSYAPCRVQTKVAGNVPVRVTVESEYPFDGEVAIGLDVERPAEFAIHLRIPAWAEGARVRWKGKSMTARAGEMAVVKERWKKGDRIRLSLPMNVAAETRDGAMAIRRGPLYFSLRVGAEYRKTRIKSKFSESIDYRGSVDWELRPATPWNYALEQWPQNIKLRRHATGAYPFADTGEMVYSEARKQYERWSAPAAVEIQLKGRRLPNWGLKDEMAADPPASPVEAEGEAETLTLIPYGAARLRVSLFPWARGQR